MFFVFVGSLDVYHIQSKNRKNIFIGFLRFCIEYFYESKKRRVDFMHQQMETRKEIKLLNTEIDLCNQIKKLLIEKGQRYSSSKQEYTDYEILKIALNRLMN